MLKAQITVDYQKFDSQAPQINTAQRINFIMECFEYWKEQTPESVEGLDNWTASEKSFEEQVLGCLLEDCNTVFNIIPDEEYNRFYFGRSGSHIWIHDKELQGGEGRIIMFYNDNDK